MKLVIPRELLLQRLQVAASVCPTRSPRPILSDVLLSADGKHLQITATDGDAVSIRLHVTDDAIEGDGQAALPAATLLSAVRSMDSESVTIEAKGGTHEIRGGKALFKLNGDDPDLFPVFHEVNVDHGVTVPYGDFTTLCQRTMFAAAREMGRYAFNGVLLELDPSEITLVATDGRRLALARLDVTTGIAKRKSAVVPLKGLTQLQRVDAADDQTLRVDVRDNVVAFALPDTEIVAQVVEGEFPDFRAVLPGDTDVPKVVAIDREQLANAIQRATITAGNEGPSVELNLNAGTLSVLSRHEGVGESRSEVDVEYDGDEVGIRFNPTFLAEYLKTVDEGQVDFRFRDRASAGLFRSSDRSLYVVMPITS
ncbi:MAG: DNA polymerase III subunit beta [Planctomycetes bacterium]|nr:DNA polymerase III subunit beta [Planctomycetota bacterium]